MKFLTFAFVINFILVCWPKLDIITCVKVKYNVRIVTCAALCTYLFK